MTWWTTPITHGFAFYPFSSIKRPNKHHLFSPLSPFAGSTTAQSSKIVGYCTACKNRLLWGLPRMSSILKVKIISHLLNSPSKESICYLSFIIQRIWIQVQPAMRAVSRIARISVAVLGCWASSPSCSFSGLWASAFFRNRRSHSIKCVTDPFPLEPPHKLSQVIYMRTYVHQASKMWMVPEKWGRLKNFVVKFYILKNFTGFWNVA